MNSLHRTTSRAAACVAVVATALLCSGPAVLAGQDKPQAPPDRAKVLTAAREIMTALQYCALVTIDETGRPQVRTMNPFQPDENMVVWMATSPQSRKANEIRKDPRVSLYYSDHAKATGYVNLTGRAVLVSDMQEILKRKRDYWDTAFPGLKNLVLIKVIPERIEVVNYKAGLGADPVTFRATTIDMPVK
jgi:general stress protein 26